MKYKNRLPSDEDNRIHTLVEFKEKITSLHRTYREISADLAIQTFNSNNNVEDEIATEINKIDELLNQNSNFKVDGKKLIFERDTIERNQLIKLTQEYDQKSLREVKEKLNTKVKKLIEASIRKKTDEKITYVESERDSILNKITGRNRIKEARINNLTTRLQYELEKNKASNPKNSIRGILTDLYKCADTYYGGTLTQEMQEIERAIRRNFKVGKHELPKRSKLSPKLTYSDDNLLATQKKTPRFFKWIREKKEIQYIDADTHQLNNMLLSIRSTQSKKTYELDDNTETSYSKIIKTLKNIRELTITERKFQL